MEAQKTKNDKSITIVFGERKTNKLKNNPKS